MTGPNPNSTAVAKASHSVHGPIQNALKTILSVIYDRMIVHMTEKWYRAVLERQEEGSTILDVGIGTAGALLKCKDLILQKNLNIIGIDYNPYYIAAAHDAIQAKSLSDHVQVHHCDLYDEQMVRQVLLESNATPTAIDAVYFSGSFSLLPDPSEALRMVATNILKSPPPPSSREDERPTTTKTRGEKRIYITQTYQRVTPPFLPTFKRWMKFFLTIDFGTLTTEEDVMRILEGGRVVEVLDLEEHGVLGGSVDNYWQAAYLTVLKLK